LGEAVDMDLVVRNRWFIIFVLLCEEVVLVVQVMSCHVVINNLVMVVIHEAWILMIQESLMMILVIFLRVLINTVTVVVHVVWDHDLHV
jgi:hypothetical protein